MSRIRITTDLPIMVTLCKSNSCKFTVYELEIKVMFLTFSSRWMFFLLIRVSFYVKTVVRLVTVSNVITKQNSKLEGGIYFMTCRNWQKNVLGKPQGLNKRLYEDKINI